MAIPIVNSRELKNTWRILDDKLGNYRDRGLPFKFPYVGAFSQSVSEWFIKVYSNPGDTVFEPFCVCKDSVVLLNQQDKIRIQDIEKRKKGQSDIYGSRECIDSVVSIKLDHSKNHDDRDDLIRSSSIVNTFIKDSKNIDIFEIRTRNGRRLNASGNHVFLTKNRNQLEWKQLKDVLFGDMVAVFPSIIHTDCSIEKENVILNEHDILCNLPDNLGNSKVLNELKNAGLLPLKNSDHRLHVIARLCGFLITDGYMQETESSNRIHTNIVFTSGSEHSLLDILNDVKLLGFDIDYHIRRKSDDGIDNIDEDEECDIDDEDNVDEDEECDIDDEDNVDKNEEFPIHRCFQLHFQSKAIYTFFKALGVPIGRKTNTSFGVPNWIYDCSKRVKQEFLGGLFGGDGETILYINRTKSCGMISGGTFHQSKISELESSLLKYLSEISSLLKEFGIGSRASFVRSKYRKDGKKTVTYRLRLECNQRTTLRFLTYIGYRYDNYKLERTYPIYEYLLTKQNRIGIDTTITKNHSNFIMYDEWKDNYVSDGVVFDDVIIVKKIEYNDQLHDLSILDTNNYIVNGFITHNSGRGTTIMQSLWNDRNIIASDLSPYSNVLCHSIMFAPYMRDVIVFINILEDYICSDRCNISTEYAGKGSDNDTAKLYHEKTFDKIIKLRNILNSRDVLLGFREDLFGEIGHEYKDDQKMFHTYRHEIVMFARLVMSQLMLHSSQDMSFNGIKTRGTDNTYIKGILKYYDSLGESPRDVNIFENMRHYVNHMGLDELGVKNKFGRLSRKLISCDARKLDLPDKCADMIVTSPPYYANLNYGMANWLRIWSIGGIGDPLVGGHINSELLETKDNSEIYGKTYDRITDRAGGTVDNPMAYGGFTGQYLHELYRVLKDDAVAIIVVGDYGNKRKVEAWRLVTDRAEIFGFKPIMVIMDELNKQTKSSTQFQMKHDGGKNDYDVCVVLYKGNYKQKNDPENIDFRWGAKFVDGSQLDIESAWGNV